jgi:hypothetical protein
LQNRGGGLKVGKFGHFWDFGRENYLSLKNNVQNKGIQK